ncbi:hypothetical protein COO20_23670 [Thalassospira marina]|uniref:Uncharacterized protein n=1 Tax=Thalassospira marina TaxID=2048283 RepID=A0A2N3KET2_9PROT|nr:hypothetical protein COO20_23670 [Thalassospira marina]
MAPVQTGNNTCFISTVLITALRVQMYLRPAWTCGPLFFVQRYYLARNKKGRNLAVSSFFKPAVAQTGYAENSVANREAFTRESKSLPV